MSIRFHLDGRPVEVDDVPPTETLLWFLRRRLGRTGTKEGCAEGDCGACTVAVLDAETRRWRAINSCLLLLPMLHGRHVVTVEGLAAGGVPHPAQQAMVDALGSQCGYCTPGVVMSAFEATYREDLDAAWKIDDQMCGNLCRCTGYRSIRDAVREVGGTRPDDRFRALLDRPPEEDLELDYTHRGERFVAPATFEALWDALEVPGARLVAGATDLGLEVTRRHARYACLVSLAALSEIRRVERTAGGWSLGGAVRLSDLEDATQEDLPVLARMLRYFGARQIKHGGTIGGNVCNASPIGDLPPVLLALDAVIVARSREGERRIPIDDFFVGYRQTALRPGEILARVEVPDPHPDARLGAYKVSRRRELDISAVCAAMAVRVEGGVVREARIAYGGMAATPARARHAEDALVGQPWDEAAVEQAAAALSTDFTPIDDHRGSAWYRSTVAANLLRGFFEETAEDPVPRLPTRPTGTVQVPR